MFEEFARKVSPNIHLFGNNDIHLDPAITAEFAHAVYRFGHSMLDENVNRYQIGPDGTPVLDANGQPVLNEIGLIDAFLNPLAFAAHGANATGEIVLGSVNQVGNEIDEFVTGALRNNLLGLPLDLAALNIARGRDTGVAPLNLLRNQIYTELNTGGTNDTTMKPYASWDEFGQFLKHAGSLVNFVAAYGTHASILGATTLVDKRAAALALVANGAIDSVTFDQDAYDFMHSTGPLRQRRHQSAGGARDLEHRLGHRSRHGRSVDRRPGREAEPVRRPARLDLQLHLREPDGGHPGRRPSLLPAAHRGHCTSAPRSRPTRSPS